MSSAPIRRDFETRVQSAVRRGTSSSQVGSRKVTSPDVGTVGAGGRPEVFVEPYDEAISFARGYVHITFDPDGTFV